MMAWRDGEVADVDVGERRLVRRATKVDEEEGQQQCLGWHADED